MRRFVTARLIARDWTVQDAESAFAIYGNDKVTRWLGPQPRSPVSSLDEMRERLERWIARDAEQPDFGLWALELRISGALVGAVVLRPLPDGEVEVGWHLNPDHWGHGYATEAGQGAIDLAFGRYGLSEVRALVDPGNRRSLAVCRRLGMVHLGRTDRYFGLSLELFFLRHAAGADHAARG
jgi:RimJ/RimL family protein N-acetyltransferase